MVINFILDFWSIHIGLNLITSLIVGILGVPGAIALVIISIFI
ncbi:MAG: pro-sigmaK processing inhibitor BofA family protein [Clostridia bacterium]|nr:pro-sigmaK processing inhibitor BofA family protein [Clostridia bacterium]